MSFPRAEAQSTQRKILSVRKAAKASTLVYLNPFLSAPLRLCAGFFVLSHGGNCRG
jgi:hypothetical protein